MAGLEGVASPPIDETALYTSTTLSPRAQQLPRLCASLEVVSSITGARCAHWHVRHVFYSPTNNGRLSRATLRARRGRGSGAVFKRNAGCRPTAAHQGPHRMSQPSSATTKRQAASKDSLRPAGKTQTDATLPCPEEVGGLGKRAHELAEAGRAGGNDTHTDDLHASGADILTFQ
eukprot:362906-Chlamydomonas_euryale.AAC.7